MASVSSDVNAGDDATALQYNNLREDVLDPITGHKHDGSADGGSALGSPLIPKGADLVGDGSDGDVTINAPTTIRGLKKYNNLTLNDSLKPESGKHFLFIMVKGTLTINNGGSIDVSGFGGAPGAPGVGGDGFVSNFEDLPSESELGAGGGGGGNPGFDGVPAIDQVAAAIDAGENLFIAYGAGGGSSNNDGGDEWAGGGGGGGGAFDGGAGGGCIVIFADTIIVNAGGSILADGVDGAGAAVSGAGGGGGGLVYLAYRNLTNNGTITAAKGIGGSTGEIEEGGDGAPGMFVQKVIPA